MSLGLQSKPNFFDGHPVLFTWCHVLRSATECCCHLGDTDVLLAHSKVGQLDVALVCQEDVIGLEVSVNNASAVKKLQGQAYLRHIELGPFVRKGIFLENEASTFLELFSK